MAQPPKIPQYTSIPTQHWGEFEDFYEKPLGQHFTQADGFCGGESIENSGVLLHNRYGPGQCGVKVEIPALRAAYVPAQNLSFHSQTPLALAFPVLTEYDYWFQPAEVSKDSDDEAFGVGKTDYAQINVSSMTQITGGDLGSLVFRKQWAELPEDFGSVSEGLAILVFRRDQDGEMAELEGAIGCSVDPRWIMGVNWQTTSRNDWAWASFGRATKSTIMNRRSPPSDYGGERLFLPVNDGSWCRIRLSQKWLEALTPNAPGRNTSTIVIVLEYQVPQLLNVDNFAKYFDPISPELIPFVEHIVSTLLVDGIQRIGTRTQPSAMMMREIFGYTLAEKSGHQTKATWLSERKWALTDAA
ncbi:hypothetical protein B0T10DRAFT_558849 [Thelonectria olida]|uniref:Uncharacterized protein n=1 Tax=Thelonectria olida TaxID=1576542 RepID=A0A9P8WAL9_9HYPO|nr:hypothetical protein B0T10DRAFT_558849 [Thelonectria olida]